MANNLIQIKRSLNTASPGSLANGELAFTANGDVLFIGSNSSVVAIGGKRNPGVLTANQALIANSSSAIDKIIVANAVITSIYANSSSGSAGQVLTSNSTGIYWSTPSAGVAGANSQVQFNANGTLAGDADFTFDGVANILTLTGTINTTTINAATHSVGTATVANSTGVFTTGTVNGAVLSVGTASIANSTGVFTTGTANAATLSVGSNFSANSTRVVVGSTVGFQANGSLGTAGHTLHSNGTAIYWAADDNTTYDLTAVANTTTNQGLLRLTDVNNSNDTVNFVGSNGVVVSSNSSAILITGQIDTDTQYDLLAIANTSANEGRIRLKSSGNANDDVLVTGTGSVVVSSNATHVIIDSTADITSVTAGSGLTGGGTSGDVTLDVGAGNGISVAADSVAVNAQDGLVANTSGLFVRAGTGVTVNATGVHIGQAVGTTSAVTFQDLTVNGNTILGSNTQDLVTVNGLVGSNFTPSANVTYSLGTNALRWNEGHFANVHSVDGYFDGSVQISGNLTVLGDVFTVNVATLAVEDSLIQLASNNTSTDLLDIGFFGNYNTGGAPHEHAGLFRDASDNGVFKLFLGLQDAPGATVNTAGTGYTTGTLEAYLKSGGLISNATNIAITANSTLAVAIVANTMNLPGFVSNATNIAVTANSTLNVAIAANTLTLSTALVATSGGTGQSSFTAGDILTASNTTFLSKLALGTSGYVLQSNGTALVYDTLDGGTF